MLAIDALLVFWHFFHYCLHYHLTANSHERRNCWHEIWMVFSVSFFFWIVSLASFSISYMLLGVLCLRKELVLELGYQLALRRTFFRAWYAFIPVCKRSGYFPALEYYTSQGGNNLDVSATWFHRNLCLSIFFPSLHDHLYFECVHHHKRTATARSLTQLSKSPHLIKFNLIITKSFICLNCF